ncbi:hypothetical protein HELRODRAFT_191013 [Helobdella robusta]|uniref:DH domain-containing protein n=1 Tax=Helobdella robusta TaxID=6412 RepID=T1FSI0_HELRO|nr:hypothetical protein HELRODRAFT_191013 [Helobdella robusta]ESO07690.1 hypothetical protein HELRODRAFT_191013 [Helobdella robusta]
MELEHQHQHQQHHDQDDVDSDSSKKVHQSAATPPPPPSSPPSSPSSSPPSSPPLSTSTDQLIMNQPRHQQQHHQDQEQQSQDIVSEKKYNLSDSFEDYLKHLSSFLRFDSPDKWLPSMRSANSSIESLTSLSDGDDKNDLDDNCASSAVSLDINCAQTGVVSKLKYDMAELEQNVLNECLSDDDDELDDLMIKMPYPIPSQRLPLILENDSDDISQSSRHSQFVESDMVPNEKLQNINNFDGDSTRCNNNDNHSISSRNNHSISSRNNRRLTCEEFITHLRSARESCSKSLQIKTHFNKDEDLPNCENESGSYADKKLTADTKLEGNAEVQAASKDVTEEIVVDVKVEKNKKKRVKVIEELLATEATYFRHLELIVSLFMQPLMDSHIIPEPAIVEIFGNIRLIMSVNMELSSHMRSESIGQAFLHLAPFLKLYSTYAQNHERALAVLLEWDQKSAEFSKFRRQQEELADMNGLKLNALLITPVQRIPRWYKLLLEELLSCTPLDHDDYWPIKNAVVEVQHVASHINEHIRQQDNFMKMLAIQKCFNASNAPRIFVPGRMFIKEGPLRKVSQHGNKSHERMFFLFSDMLMYAKPTALSNTTTTNNNTNNNCYNNINSNNYHSLVCCCMLPLHHCKVEQVLGGADGQGLLFTVTCKKEHLLLFSDQKTANNWITVLNKQISEIRSSRQTLRKRSSVQQPMRSEGFMKFLRRRNNHNNDADHDDNQTFKSTPEKMKQAKKHAEKVIRKQQLSRQKQQSILSKLTPSTANHAAAAARKLNCDSNRWTSTCTQQNLPNKHFSSGLACLKKNKKKMFLEDQEAGKPKVFADLTIVEEHHGIFAGNNNITLNDTIDIISQPNTNYIININNNISEFKRDIKSEKDDMKSPVPSSATMQSTHSTTPNKHVGRADVETSHKNINNNCVITPKTPNQVSASANKAAFSTRTLNKFISKTIYRRHECGRPTPSPSKLATQTPTALESTATFTKQMPATETRVSAIKKSFIHQRTKSYNDCSSSSSSTILSNTDRPKKTSVELNLPSGQRVATACDYRDSDASHEQIDRDQLRLSLKRSQPKKLDAKNFPTTPRSNSVFASKLIRTPSKLFSSPADSISPSPILARSSSKQGNIGEFNCYSPLTNVEASSNSNNIYQCETRGTVEPGEFDNRNNNENINPRDTVGECDMAINLSPFLRMDCNISRNVTIRKRSKLLRSSTLIVRKDLPRVSKDSGCCSDIIGANELNRYHSAPGQEDGHADVDGNNYYDGDSDEAEACVLRNLSFKLALSEN